MKLLVACEESQAVCGAFRARGHEAYSCDIIEPSGGHPEWHIKQDVLPLLDGRCEFDTMDGTHHVIPDRWDMIIAHPPCTYLTTAANRSYSLRVTSAEKVVARYQEKEKAIVFFLRCYFADCPKVVVENPQGSMNTIFRKPDQTIHPYFFANDESDKENYVQKKTCLWLRNVSPLQRINFLPKPSPKYICKGEKSYGKAIGWCEGMSGMKDRAKARAKTFPGVAAAMAEQWG